MAGTTVTPPARGQARLLERDEELRRIDDTVREGALLVVEGPAGIGKTALVCAARERAAAAGATVLSARGREMEQGHPFGVVLELVQPADGDDVALEGLLAQTGAPPHEFMVMRAIYGVIAAMARERPVVLVVDDAQWADDQSLRALLYVTERLDRIAAAVIVAVRTGDGATPAPLVARLQAASGPALRPHPLTAEATRALLAAGAPALAQDARFVRATHEVTGGNPFLLTELLAAVHSGPGAWEPGDVERLRGFAPETVARTISIRLAAHGHAAGRLATALAVLGDGSPLGRVATLAGLDAPETADAVARLLDGAFLAAAPTGTLAFRHPMLRAAVLAAQPAGVLARAHADAARLMHADGGDAQDAAEHLMQARPTTERWARQVLHEAGRAALAKGAPEAAMRPLLRAVATTPAGERDAQLLVDLGLAEAACGRTTSLARFTEAVDAATDPAQQERAMDALGRTQLRYGRHEAAARTFGAAAALLADRAPAAARRFRGAELIAGVFDPLTETDASRRLTDWAASLTGRPPRDNVERALLGVFACVQSATTAPAADVAPLARAALADDELLREETSESIALLEAVRALIVCGAWSETLPVLDAAVEDAQRRGSLLALAESVSVRAWARWRAGLIVDAMADARLAIEAREHGFRMNVPVPESRLARCLLLRGDVTAAARVLDDVEPLAVAAPLVLRMEFDVARLHLHLQSGAPERALQEFDRPRELLDRDPLLSPALIQWRPVVGQALHALGSTDAALRVIDEEIRVARRFGVAAPLGAALVARGRIEGGENGTATLEEAVAVLEHAAAPVELAEALCALGVVQRGAGTADPRPALMRALDIAARCGALAIEREAREALVASGARPRRARTTGPEALTASERRIAELAAAGFTNKQIAETLVLTEHTVKWHLRRVFRKLGIGSRDRLADVLAHAHTG